MAVEYSNLIVGGVAYLDMVKAPLHPLNKAIIQENFSNAVCEIREIAARPHSPTFYVQMAYLRIGYQLCFRNRNDENKYQIQGFQYPSIVSRIRALEGETPYEFKPAKAFKRDPLKGYWHAHVEDRSIKGIASNILAELPKKVEALRRDHSDEEAMEELPNNFVEDLIASSDQRLADGRATGEWLIYDKDQQGHNVYQTLATHAEEEQSIIDRIVHAGQLIP